ncbi:MAG: asparagine--tRNA ligase [Chloroflexi bacterium]|nr:asparagine--tRNA ligase [Chloroflexota bacterium]
MARIISVEQIADHVGEEVVIRGWVYLRTDKGRLQFIRVRDGTGFVQVVVFKKNVPPEAFQAARKVTQESSVIVTGIVREDERAPGVPGGYEIDARDFVVVQQAEEYPIQPKEHGVDFLLDHRHLWLRTPRQWAIMRVRAEVERAIVDWLDSHGFLRVDTPILTPSAAEGTTTLFETDFHGRPAYLAQTGQLYNEANIFAFGKVYCFGPTFRAEKSKTRRHLQEFWMVEPEIAWCDLDELMEIEEQFVSYIVQRVLERRANELKVLERDTRLLENVVPPFPRISYDEAVEMVNKAAAAGVRVPPHDEPVPPMEWGDDFGAPHETYIASQFDRPVFIHHFPTAAKAFYMEPEPGRPEVCRSADLLAPEGYGEIIGGSERMSDPDKLVESIKKHGLPLEPYKWYIDLRRYGSVPHSGFGLGVERTVAWICGLHHVRETIAFPRVLGRIYP